ncbi:putative bifunctional diguanylate cyclase/phosphodiesterase [Microbaculum marinisediminis]|uniref:EAL domain-containing protein n=1 Tax=Microbaculum marinisediminis TaxID=2931392 RepID=A0AAW5QZR0_9HYPH|nr:EAL domain-containing protein [Microbaculum sp. A6E488]MCT8971926.1 EAL domain-containing protein [Microbaculum sp. A6E488]
MRTLRLEADTVVEAIQNYIENHLGPDLTFKYADHHPSNPRTIAIPGANTLHADLRSVLVLAPDGDIAVPSPPQRKAFDFLSASDHGAFERAVRSGTLQYLRVDPDRSKAFRTVFYVPVMSVGQLAGVIRMDIDQTRDARLLQSTVWSRRIVYVILGVLGLSIMSFVFWRFIRERRFAEDEARFLAMHDVLTGLPNRAQFKQRLNRALETARRDGTSVAVICIDVDNFKDINDTLGHPIGDRILKTTAERILAMSGPSSTVARLSGDEFAVLIEGISDTAALRGTAQRMLRNTSIVNEIDGQELVCSISLGISIAPADGNDVDTLIKNADVALYRAKSEGRNTIRFFTADMDREFRRRRQTEDELRRDLGTDRFKVYYQPQFDLRTGSLTGYEALARWTSPALGPVSPEVFIPAAEACGLIAPLSEWILTKACRAATEWPEPVKLAVNLSAAQFRTGDVADMIERVLRWTTLPPDRLEIEITETALLRNTETARSALNRLRGIGVSIALDDFGTGYSSLSYLSRFPIDKIKIDRSFVQRLTADRNTSAIVQAIVGLGKALDLEIIAEGVETHDQVAQLRAIGCHRVQGYLFGRPRETVGFPIPEVVRRLQDLDRASA